METIKNIASKIGKVAVWLWSIPVVKSEALTLLARIGLGSGIVGGIVIAIINAYAANPVTF